MLFGIGSHDRQSVLNNAVTLAKAASLFNVPVVLSTVAAKTFSGDLLPEIQAVFPDEKPIDRTTMNSWEDRRFKSAVTGFGRNKLVVAGLWTEVCICFPALDAIAEGYDVHVPTDACGDISAEAHERAVQRAIQAGVVPMTTLQVMFEWQRDWARTETYDGCMEILKAHSPCGIGRYAEALAGQHASTARAAAGEVRANRKACRTARRKALSRYLKAALQISA
jgi:nicotinamidase-related amidase